MKANRQASQSNIPFRPSIVGFRSGAPQSKDVPHGVIIENDSLSRDRIYDAAQAIHESLDEVFGPSGERLRKLK